MIFLLYEDFTKENVIPNGFNMSISEFNAHRYKLSTPHNLNFKIEDIVLSTNNFIPIHKETYNSNPDFFHKNGKIYYMIHPVKPYDQYSEFYIFGMNFWLNYIDKDIISLIKKGDIKLILTSLSETSDVKNLYELLKNVQTFLGTFDNFEFWNSHCPPSRSYFPQIQSFQENNLVNFQKTIDDFVDNHYRVYDLLEDKFDKVLVDIPYWEHFTCQFYDETNLVLPKKKKYISLCRRYTEERLLTHCYLVSHDLLKHGYNSIPEFCTIKKTKLKNEIEEINLDPTRKYFEIEIEKTLKYYESEPQGIELDGKPIFEEERTLYSANYIGFKSKPDLEKYYAESYISLVQIDDVDPGYYILNEKIFRAILYKHMFIVISHPLFMVSLKSKGFKTFESLWEEEYDLILDNNLRWKIALDIFEDIILNKDLDSLYKKAEPIIEHNYQVLKNRAKMYENMFKI